MMFPLGVVVGAASLAVEAAAFLVAAPRRVVVFHPVRVAEVLNSAVIAGLAYNPAKRVQRNELHNVPRLSVALPVIAPPRNSNFKPRQPSAVNREPIPELAGKQNALRDKANASRG